MKTKITLLALAICNLGFGQISDNGKPLQKQIKIQNKAGEDLGQYCGNTATYSEATDNNNSGIMFDIEATSTIRVSAVSVDLEDGFSGKVYVYRKLGTHVGSEGAPFNWLLIDSANVTDNGGITYIPISIDFVLNAGDVGALYVRGEDNTSIDYKNGATTGTDIVDDGVIVIKEGQGINGTFGSVVSNRQFLGSVHYCTPTTVVCDSATANVGSENGFNGIFFDVSTGNSSITINQFFANFISAASSPMPITIYTRSGTYVGSETSIVGWLTTSIDTLISPIPDSPEAISNTNLGLTIPANSTQGFYIYSEEGSLRYRNGNNIGDVIYSNSDLTIYTGSGSADLFTGSLLENRNFSGVIDYCVNSSASLDKLNSEEIIKLYPVPASDILNVSLSNKENGTIEIFDMYGKLVYSREADINEDSIKLDLSKWSKGTYILQHKTNTKTVVKRFNKL